MLDKKEYIKEEEKLNSTLSVLKETLDKLHVSLDSDLSELNCME